ncbi:MAG: hypothetical protein ACJAZ9_000210 [Neolewinella sp.]|jgi:hypothetical protein
MAEDHLGTKVVLDETPNLGSPEMALVFIRRLASNECQGFLVIFHLTTQ